MFRHLPLEQKTEHHCTYATEYILTRLRISTYIFMNWCWFSFHAPLLNSGFALRVSRLKIEIDIVFNIVHWSSPWYHCCEINTDDRRMNRYCVLHRYVKSNLYALFLRLNSCFVKTSLLYS
jgi:hypothetical protein